MRSVARNKTEKCCDIQMLPLKEREEKVKAAHLCFKGYIASFCQNKCSKCNGNHSFLLFRSKGEVNIKKAREKSPSDQNVSDIVVPSEYCSP